MNACKCFTLIVFCSVFAVLANAQEPSSAHLTGVWTGRERDGSQAGELEFRQGDRVSYSFEGVTVAGRYEIDESKSPNVLVFYPDKFPEHKAYALVEVKSATEIRMSHLCDGTPAALAKQSIITFTRKQPGLTYQPLSRSLSQKQLFCETTFCSCLTGRLFANWSLSETRRPPFFRRNLVAATRRAAANKFFADHSRCTGDRAPRRILSATIWPLRQTSGNPPPGWVDPPTK